MEKVVDANVILHGRGNYSFGKALTVQEVYDEIQSERGRDLLMNIDVRVKQPSEDVLEKVRSMSEKLNSPTSDADEKLIALALEYSKVLVTDDKPLQNLAVHLGTDFEGFLDPKTDKKIRWERVCESCNRVLEGSTCSRCGCQRFQRKQVGCSS